VSAVPVGQMSSEPPSTELAPPSSQPPLSEPSPSSTEEPAPSSPESEPEPPAEDEVATAPAPPARSEEEIYQDLTLFGEVFDRIRRQYVGAPDEQLLIRAAINGMLTSLDPHSGYLDPEMFKDVQQDTSGQFGGLGIEVTME